MRISRKLFFLTLIVFGLGLSWAHKLDHSASADSHCQLCVFAKQVNPYQGPVSVATPPLIGVYQNYIFLIPIIPVISLYGFDFSLRGPPFNS